MGEIKLDLEYDSAWWHNEEKQDSDDIRTEILEGDNWKVERFADKLPTEEELENVIYARLYEIDHIKDFKKGENALQREIDKIKGNGSFSKWFDEYITLGGKKTKDLFARDLDVYFKITKNTYNQAPEEELQKCWVEYIEDKEEADRFKIIGS